MNGSDFQNTISKSAVDRLGERLRAGLDADDLRLLDAWRQSFRPAYEQVVARTREVARRPVTGRPSKSTGAIRAKLLRSRMRLSQMQDVAGCRVVVPDLISQDVAVSALTRVLGGVLEDRRNAPSHGYRAVHLIVDVDGWKVELQIRTDLQHRWAELSEKLSDTVHDDLKYGGGPPGIVSMLGRVSDLYFDLEELETQPIDPARLKALRMRATELSSQFVWATLGAQ